MAKQLGFSIDTAKCIKCWSCEVACKQWNEIPAGTIARRKVYEESEGSFPAVKRTFYSFSCMHCATPACAEKCPAGAISKREEDGIVVVDKEVCIGCQTCATACPFGVPQYIDKKMDKCDCCIGNGITPGNSPHCVLACTTKALQFGEMDTEGQDFSKGDKLAAVTVPLKEPNPDPSDMYVGATVVVKAEDLAGGNAEFSAASNDDACFLPSL